MVGLLLSLALVGSDKPKIAVMRVAGNGLDKPAVEALTEVVTTEVAALGRYDVISARDIEAILGFESSKQALGCDEVSCLAELGGALGAASLLQPQVDRLDGTWVINLKLIDMKSVKAEGRVSDTLEGALPEVIVRLRGAVRTVFGARPIAVGVAGPGPLSIALWAVGAAGIGAGAYFGLEARERFANATDRTYAGGAKEVAPGERAQLFANIGFAAGAAALVGGAVSWWLSGGGSSSVTAVSGAAASLEVGP